jgi:hypothetical protein
VDVVLRINGEIRDKRALVDDLLHQLAHRIVPEHGAHFVKVWGKLRTFYSQVGMEAGPTMTPTPIITEFEPITGDGSDALCGLARKEVRCLLSPTLGAPLAVTSVILWSPAAPAKDPSPPESTTV